MRLDICYVPCGDIELCAGVAGEGHPVLFIGGTGWDLRTEATPLRSLLATRFRVVVFDQRGQGRSGKPAGPYSMRGYAEDALAVVDHFGWDAPHVIGYSFGGMVAQEYAIRFPNRVGKLVLAATTSGGAGGSSFPVQDLLSLDPEARAREGLRVSDLRFQPLEQECPDKARHMVENRQKAQTRFIAEPGAQAGLEAQLAARAQHDCFDRLPAIEAQTLVLAGQYDGQAPVPSQRVLAERIPRAQFQEIDGAHNFLFENETGYRAMARFLSDD